MGRKPVDQVIDELNFLDGNYGPFGSVVIHDSMFFQQPVLAAGMDREIPAQGAQGLALLGGGRSRHGAPVARSV